LEQLSMGEGCQLVVDGLGEDFKVGHFSGFLSGVGIFRFSELGFQGFQPPLQGMQDKNSAWQSRAVLAQRLCTL
jgi:hypothetical protein